MLLGIIIGAGGFLFIDLILTIWFIWAIRTNKDFVDFLISLLYPWGGITCSCGGECEDDDEDWDLQSIEEDDK